MRLAELIGTLSMATDVDHGRVVDVPVLEIHRNPAANQHVVLVEIANGSVLEIGAPHPTGDGRTFGDLRANDLLGGVRIERVSVVSYSAPFTYDILPASDSGTYYAGGVLIGSTLGGEALSSRGRDYSAISLMPYDILPASDGGTYFAAGVRIGSTLASDGTPHPFEAASSRLQ